MKTVIDVLQERGFIDALTSEEVKEKVRVPQKVYIGFDPSGESLHLGHLIPIMGLAWFQKFGHTPIALVGGATGMIGDPSGKSKERNLLDQKTIEKNVEGIRKNLSSILKEPLLYNNYDWFKNFSFIDFLRDVGKHFRMGVMLAKESVKARLQSEEGLSFTEFSYQTLQAYDFLHLFQKEKVCLQLGGSDQWGNIVAGVELIRKVRGESAFGITFPLLKRSDGKKFGKTEEGAIWLSAEKCSPYTFYQYLFLVPDADVIMLMKMLTFMELSEIASFEKRLKEEPNRAQKKLAEEVTRIVHGEEGLKMALKATEGAKPGSDASLDPSVLQQIAKEMPHKELKRGGFVGKRLVDLLADAGLIESRGEAKRLIKGGGVYLNNEKIVDELYTLAEKDLIDKAMCLIALGKKNKTIIKILD